MDTSIILKRYHGLKTHTQTTPQPAPTGKPSSVKSLRLVIKNRVKTYMKTRTKKLKACDKEPNPRGARAGLGVLIFGGFIVDGLCVNDILLTCGW